ncbi:hypothetical protein EJB05_41514, partial [Eragrostis curvula]
MAATQSPLRRWKRFFATFDAIDAAIPAPGPGQRAGDEVLRQAKSDVVQLLCDATEDDEAEELCGILDDVMADYLVALKSAPMTSRALASTGLAKAVGYLREHESERVRGLASDIVRGWRESVKSDLAEATARVEELAKLCAEALAPKTTRPSVVGAEEDSEKKKKQLKVAPCRAKSACVEPAKRDAPAKIAAAPLPKKSAPVVGADHTSMDKMMEATKRKLREGYQEAADAKRQRKIVVIEAPPKMVQQRKMHPIIRERSQARSTTTTTVPKKMAQRKTHPIIRERSLARCAGSTAAAVMPSFYRV